MKKFYLIIFCVIAIILTILIFGHSFFFPKENNITTSKVVIPIANNEKNNFNTQSNTENDNTSISMTSFIPLQGDETLIGTHSVDFNNDTYEDQIIAIKKANSSFITLIIGLYKPQLTLYERSIEIPTEISQVKTFSFTTLDITGERLPTLIYTGFTDSNESVLQAFNPDTSDSFNVKQIVNLKSTGSIFIESSNRSDAYAMSMVQGESFPIWVYSTDSEKPEGSFDQVQTKYVWNSPQREYIKQYETRVAGKKIEAKELARIQDGTVETFLNFLEGLWVRTSSNTNATRYLFFDKTEKEVIFILDSTQEIYTFTNTTLRRNGIYMSTENKSISNLSRRLDITLLAPDEIRIKLNDDVRMIIGEETLWDGQYKKMPQNSAASSIQSKPTSSIINQLKTNKNSWILSDGNRIVFSEKQYSIHTDNGTQTGSIATVTIKNEVILQCKTNNSTILPSGFYRVIESTAEQKDKSKEFITFVPVTLTTTGLLSSSGKAIQLERDSEVK